jgi:hypothetical protein
MILHFKFQTVYNRDGLLRFADYDLRLYKQDRREVRTVVIYFSDVKAAAAGFKIGSL